jgi:8-oxo-dGTP pyrophosphatase MutT (NUDIX family)
MPALIDKVAWTPIRDRRILFARTRGKDVFYTIGGKREPGESDEQTLVREVREETGITLIADTIKHVHTFVGSAHGQGADARVQIACYDAHGSEQGGAVARNRGVRVAL